MTTGDTVEGEQSVRAVAKAVGGATLEMAKKPKAAPKKKKPSQVKVSKKAPTKKTKAHTKPRKNQEVRISKQLFNTLQRLGKLLN